MLTRTLLVLACASVVVAADYADLLTKPSLSRKECAVLASDECQAHIASMPPNAALAIVKSSADSSARLAVAWVKGLDKALKPGDRLPFLAAIYNHRVGLDPFSAKMVFGWAAQMHTKEYAKVSLANDLRTAGWAMGQADFDVLIASYAGMYAN